MRSPQLAQRRHEPSPVGDLDAHAERRDRPRLVDRQPARLLAEDRQAVLRQRRRHRDVQPRRHGDEEAVDRGQRLECRARRVDLRGGLVGRVDDARDLDLTRRRERAGVGRPHATRTDQPEAKGHVRRATARRARGCARPTRAPPACRRPSPRRGPARSPPKPSSCRTSGSARNSRIGTTPAPNSQKIPSGQASSMSTSPRSSRASTAPSTSFRCTWRSRDA